MHDPQASVLASHSTTARSPSVAVTAASTGEDGFLTGRAQRLADELGLPCVERVLGDHEFLLTVCTDRIELHQPFAKGCRPVWVDLLRRDTRLATGGASKRQPIARAVGLYKRKADTVCHVVDATAGFGQDSWLLASLGCCVTAVERSPIVAVLLRDGLRRAILVEPEVADRITLVTADAREVLPAIEHQPDVVYLDPMFPPKRKSALERRSVRVLRQIVGSDADAKSLFKVSLAVAGSRVVVKRPKHAFPLASTPASSHVGKSVRYDVYTTSTHRADSGG